MTLSCHLPARKLRQADEWLFVSFLFLQATFVLLIGAISVYAQSTPQQVKEIEEQIAKLQWVY
jgi:hypothetical protein